MKQIELELEKRLLIVEASEDLSTKGFWYDGEMHLKIKLIYKGSELTEEITKELVEEINHVYKNYNDGNWKPTALESFISAIEAQGYYWGENPEGDEPNKSNYVFEDHPELVGNPKEYNEMAYLIDLGEWQEAESKTFNPEKTLIFEILL